MHQTALHSLSSLEDTIVPEHDLRGTENFSGLDVMNGNSFAEALMRAFAFASPSHG